MTDNTADRIEHSTGPGPRQFVVWGGEVEGFEVVTTTDVAVECHSWMFLDTWRWAHIAALSQDDDGTTASLRPVMVTFEHKGYGAYDHGLAWTYGIYADGERIDSFTLCLDERY